MAEQMTKQQRCLQGPQGHCAARVQGHHSHCVQCVDGTSSSTTARGNGGHLVRGAAGLLTSAWGSRPNLGPPIFLLWLEESRGREISRGQRAADTALFLLQATYTCRSSE